MKEVAAAVIRVSVAAAVEVGASAVAVAVAGLPSGAVVVAVVGVAVVVAAGGDGADGQYCRLWKVAALRHGTFTGDNSGLPHERNSA